MWGRLESAWFRGLLVHSNPRRVSHVGGTLSVSCTPLETLVFMGKVCQWPSFLQLSACAAVTSPSFLWPFPFSSIVCSILSLNTHTELQPVSLWGSLQKTELCRHNLESVDKIGVFKIIDLQRKRTSATIYSEYE